MISKKICAYCHSAIKNESEEILCKSCSTPYHKDCWNENEGCAVYGCTGKRNIEIHGQSLSLNDILVNIEYLINQHKFEEAIHDAKKYLEIFKNNTELKSLYNRAVSLINSKIKLIEDADRTFEDEEYSASKIYYENALKYADENEFTIINAKLDVIKERIPEQKKRRVFNRVLTSIMAALIIFSLIYLGYYVFILKEDREFAEIERYDPADQNDLRAIELQIAKYENFLNRYYKGRKAGSVRDKINSFSLILAEKFSETDWRMGLNYLSKVTYSNDMKYMKDLKNKIEDQANSEYIKYVSNANQLNRNRKYNEAISELDKAIAVAEYFPYSEFTKEKNQIRSNIELLNNKISYLIRSQSLGKEISEYEKELTKYSPATEGRNSIYLAIKINDEVEPGIYIGREVGTENIIAIKSVKRTIEPGELITTFSYKNGNYNYDNGGWNTMVPLYIPSTEMENINSHYSSLERESILQRLNNLRYQKQRLDSLLNLKLM